MDDQRDIIEDVIGKEWHPFLTFEELFKLLPDYFRKLKVRETSGELYCDQWANFEVNTYYSLTTFEENFDVCKIFKVSDITVSTPEEEMNSELDLNTARNICVLSDNVLLIFDPVLSHNKAKLITWGMISSIEHVKRNMERKEFISIVWTSSFQQPLFSQDMNLEDDDEIGDNLD